MIVGITGKAGAGKNELADMLAKELGYGVVSMASPIKQIAKILFGLTDREVEEGERLQHIDGTNMTVRELLIYIGVGFRNDVSEDIWLNKLLRDNKGKDIIVSDIRFNNEATACDFVVNIERDEKFLHYVANGKGSEDGVHDCWIDETVANTGTIADSNNEAIRIAKLIKE